MSKFYLAKARNGRYLKIVEDVRVPVSDKLHELGRMPEAYIVRQRLVARFVNEEEALHFLCAYNEVYQDGEL